MKPSDPQGFFEAVPHKNFLNRRPNIDLVQII